MLTDHAWRLKYTPEGLDRQPERDRGRLAAQLGDSDPPVGATLKDLLAR